MTRGNDALTLILTDSALIDRTSTVTAPEIPADNPVWRTTSRRKAALRASLSMRVMWEERTAEGSPPPGGEGSWVGGIPTLDVLESPLPVPPPQGGRGRYPAREELVLPLFPPTERRRPIPGSRRRSRGRSSAGGRGEQGGEAGRCRRNGGARWRPECLAPPGSRLSATGAGVSHRSPGARLFHVKHRRRPRNLRGRRWSGDFPGFFHGRSCQNRSPEAGRCPAAGARLQANRLPPSAPVAQKHRATVGAKKLGFDGTGSKPGRWGGAEARDSRTVAGSGILSRALGFSRVPFSRWLPLRRANVSRETMGLPGRSARCFT